MADNSAGESQRVKVCSFCGAQIPLIPKSHPDDMFKIIWTFKHSCPRRDALIEELYRDRPTLRGVKEKGDASEQRETYT